MEKISMNAPGSGGLASTIDLQNHAADVEYFSIMNAPVTKLDADQYVAEDIDGVTESVFGSGNLNFLLMQSGQTNEAMALVDPFLIQGEAPTAAGGLTSGAYFNSSNYDAGNGFDLGGPDFSIDRAIADTSSSNENSGFGGQGGSNSATLNSLGASSMIANSGIVEPLHGINGFDGAGNNDGISGKSGINGTNGTNGEGINILNEVTNIAGDIINLGDTFIQGDLIEEVIENINNLEEVVNNITDIVDNSAIINLLEQTILGDNINDVTDWVTNTVNNVTNTTTEAADVVNNILEEVIGEGDLITNVTNILENPADIVTNVTNLIENLDTSNLLTEIINTTTTTTNLVNNLLGNGDNTDSEVELSSNIDLGFVDTSALDPVLNLLDNQALQLDVVEDLIGDIDVGTGLGLDLLGQNGNVTDNSNGDSDLSLGLDLGLIDNAIFDGSGGLSLDTIEDITGDIDLDLGLGGNILGNLADPVVNNDEGGTGDESSPLAMLGNSLGENTGSVFDTLDGENNQGSDILADTAGSLIDSNILDLGGNASLDIVENLLGQNIEINSDDSLSGQPLLEDIDLDDLTGGNGEDGLLSGVDDLLGDGAGDALGVLADPFGADGAASDVIADLTLPDIDFLDVGLDPVEDALGDIDLDIGGAIDLLNAVVDSGVGDLGGGNASGGDIGAWTENVLPNAGDLTGGALGDTLGAILPDPVGGIAEGLGSVLGNTNDNQPHHGGLFGGLFG